MSGLDDMENSKSRKSPDQRRRVENLAAALALSPVAKVQCDVPDGLPGPWLPRLACSCNHGPGSQVESHASETPLG